MFMEYRTLFQAKLMACDGGHDLYSVVPVKSHLEFGNSLLVPLILREYFRYAILKGESR